MKKRRKGRVAVEASSKLTNSSGPWPLSVMFSVADTRHSGLICVLYKLLLPIPIKLSIWYIVSKLICCSFVDTSLRFRLRGEIFHIAKSALENLSPWHSIVQEFRILLPWNIYHIYDIERLSYHHPP